MLGMVDMLQTEEGIASFRYEKGGDGDDCEDNRGSKYLFQHFHIY